MVDSNGLTARTAMNGTTETQQQQRRVVNGDGRHDGNSTAMDGNGRRDRDLKAMDGLTAMGSNSTVMDGAAGRQWTVRWLLDGFPCRGKTHCAWNATHRIRCHT